MNFDSTFPPYAERMNRYLLVLAAVGAVILLIWLGWTYAAAWGMGCLFHIFFFQGDSFPVAKMGESGTQQ